MNINMVYIYEVYNGISTSNEIPGGSGLGCYFQQLLLLDNYKIMCS